MHTCLHIYAPVAPIRPEQPEQEYRHRPRGYSAHKVGIEPSPALVLFGLTDAITWIDAMPYNIPSFSSLGCPLHHPSVRPPAPATSRPPSAATCRMPHNISNSYSSLFFSRPGAGARALSGSGSGNGWIRRIAPHHFTWHHFASRASLGLASYITPEKTAAHALCPLQYPHSGQCLAAHLQDALVD